MSNLRGKTWEQELETHKEYLAQLRRSKRMMRMKLQIWVIEYLQSQ